MIKALKATALQHRVPVVAVAAADEDALRQQRVYRENLWRPALVRGLSAAAESPRPVRWASRRWRSAVRVTSCVQVFRVYCVMRQVFLQMLWPAGC